MVDLRIRIVWQDNGTLQHRKNTCLFDLILIIRLGFSMFKSGRIDIVVFKIQVE